MFPGKTAGERKSSCGKTDQETEFVLICNNSSNSCSGSLSIISKCTFFSLLFCIFWCFRELEGKHMNSFSLSSARSLLTSLSFHVSLLLLMEIFLHADLFLQSRFCFLSPGKWWWAVGGACSTMGQRLDHAVCSALLKAIDGIAGDPLLLVCDTLVQTQQNIESKRRYLEIHLSALSENA